MTPLGHNKDRNDHVRATLLNPKSRPLVVIVGGSPGSGKSTLAQEVATTLGMPMIARDAFKEAMMDVITTETVADSHLVGEAAYGALFAAGEALLAAEMSFVIESNFVCGRAEKNFHGYLEKVNLVQVHCSAPDELILQRYTERAQQDDRHDGHQGEEAVPELRRDLASGLYAPLNLPVPLIAVDTSDGFVPSVAEVASRIMATIN
ncbi:MAG TPA: AAA family ATPase [Thermomicrobiales bacterium]|nr:AAA family ATPase [Thermomicrobiales bacterium]